jgi:hypothetical protein
MSIPGHVVRRLGGGEIMTTTSATLATTSIPTASRVATLAGRTISGFAALFLLFDAGVKLFPNEMVNASWAELGWPIELSAGIGILQLVLLALYVFPRTAVFGALLWTGYLGGAVATHVRVGNPWPTHILFPLYVAAFIWGGLLLRDARLRQTLNLKSITSPSATT